jgi:dUTP pyrophosphatase
MNERKFEICSAYINDNINLPKRQTISSAGYDFESRETYVFKPHSFLFIKTGIKAKFNQNETLLIFPRSSFYIKTGLLLTNAVGVIDSDYYNNKENEGEIMFPCLNTTDKEVIIEKGYRVAQGIFIKPLHTSEDSFVNIKRTSGFGSTTGKLK